jgi:small nuclear ribonucleoprotein (snRNP)-like protein
MVKSANESIRLKASNSELYEKMQEVFIEMDNNPNLKGLFQLIDDHMNLNLKFCLLLIYSDV